VLVRTCRHVKETLLSSDAPEQVTLSVPGAGARLIGGGLETQVTREDVRQLVVEGFFPLVELTAQPAKRQSGFQEFGLPYAADPAITRHLAAFLMAHRGDMLPACEPGATPPAPWSGLDHASTAGPTTGGHAGSMSPRGTVAARPYMVLFNGGIFASPILRTRLIQVLETWFRDGQWHPLVLQNERLDLAVSRGAAYYGMVRRGQGVRIAAGLARTYYVEVAADPPSAVCLVPAGVEPGHDVDLSTREFELALYEPVEFPLYVSSTRLTDAAGELVAIDREQMTPLPPIRTVLTAKKRKETSIVNVHLHARLTEIGTLELWCSEAQGPRSWQLQFDVRSATQTDIEAHRGLAEQQGVLERSAVETTRRIVTDVFEDKRDAALFTEKRAASPFIKPGGLPQRIASAIEISRDDWPMTLLRQIWEALMEVEPGRRKSADHEARWLNLLGFSLRPGYGLALDDWRVGETWRILYGKLAHATPMCRTEWWILWRRIAGGLSAGQQEALASPLMALVRKKHQQLTTGRGPGGEFAASGHEEAEVWRLLGGLERLSPATKMDLGGMLVDLLPKRRMEANRPAMAWALGRVGTRVPVYGPLNAVVPAEAAAKWLAKFLDLDYAEPLGLLAAVQMARRTGDRYRDIPDKTRGHVLEWLKYRSAPPHYQSLVAEGGQLEGEEQTLIVGEALPRGLKVL
jgi:hypothetical protein